MNISVPVGSVPRATMAQTGQLSDSAAIMDTHSATNSEIMDNGVKMIWDPISMKEKLIKCYKCQSDIRLDALTWGATQANTKLVKYEQCKLDLLMQAAVSTKIRTNGQSVELYSEMTVYLAPLRTGIKSNRVCGYCKCIREFVTISQLEFTSEKYYRCINCGSDQCARIYPKTALNSINKVKKTKRGKLGGGGIFQSAAAAPGVGVKSKVLHTAPARADGGVRHVSDVAVAVPQSRTPRTFEFEGVAPPRAPITCRALSEPWG
ncbi:unnamed protein product [Parnassius apollo]|uniref:(apollo) hypothetical protein n=1 Tax=Parnassius apollo TaxID=110799 RepID=A0A8S3W3N4_PARAO|nr:unnamed protein product [Parnassius apollo]